MLAEELASQIETHRKFGGVVPEVASRGHFEIMDELVGRVLARAPEHKLVCVAATCGPGLIGPLLVGSSYAEGYARGAGVPFVGVHHLRGHLASPLLDAQCVPGAATLRARADALFPALVLLVSGGHTQVLEVDKGLRARALADTADDAAGECFDKSAKLMGLPYPGGPEIERRAKTLTPDQLPRARELRNDLPKPRSQEGFSFSGLKTAIRLRVEKDSSLARSPEFCWAIQEAIAETLERGLDRAFDEISSELRTFVVCGGVAANQRLRERLTQWAGQRQLRALFPPIKYATDNAAMIGAAAWVQDPDCQLTSVSARLPLALEPS